MKITNRHWILLSLTLLFLCIAPYRRAQAYVDPGTGSYILQIILAALFGALFALRVFWAKITNAFKQMWGASKKR